LVGIKFNLNFVLKLNKMKVKAIDVSPRTNGWAKVALTLNKEYEANFEHSDTYRIVDDSGIAHGYYKDRFEIVDESKDKPVYGYNLKAKFPLPIGWAKMFELTKKQYGVNIRNGENDAARFYQDLEPDMQEKFFEKVYEEPKPQFEVHLLGNQIKVTVYAGVIEVAGRIFTKAEVMALHGRLTNKDVFGGWDVGAVAWHIGCTHVTLKDFKCILYIMEKLGK